MSTTDPSTVLGTAAGTVKDEVLDVGGAVLPYAAVLAALGIGWRLVRKFVKA